PGSPGRPDDRKGGPHLDVLLGQLAAVASPGAEPADRVARARPRPVHRRPAQPPACPSATRYRSRGRPRPSPRETGGTARVRFPRFRNESVVHGAALFHGGTITSGEDAS